MAVHLNTIPAQAGEVMRALIEVESGNDSNAWWLDARQDPATQGAVVAGSMAVAGVPGAAITRWRYRWGGVNNLLLNKSGGGGGMSDWVASGGILHDKFLLIAQDDIDPPIDVQIAFADFTAAGGSYCRIPITSADIVKLARLTNNFNLLNLVISDEPGSGPVPPPPPVTRDTSGDVEVGALVVSAGAEAVPAAVRDTDATITAGAPGVDADAARVEPGDADTGGDVRASAPRVSADVEVVPAGDSDTTATAGAGAPVLTVGVETVGVQAPSDVGGDVAAGAPEVDATARVVPVPSATNLQTCRMLAGAWLPRRARVAVMPIMATVEGPAEDLVRVICREICKQLPYYTFGESCIPADAAPTGTLGPSAGEHTPGAIVVSLDPNQSEPEWEDGSPEPSVSEVRMLVTQATTTDFDDLELFISRRADLRRVLSRLTGGIG